MPKDLKMCVLLDIYGQMITDKQFEVMDYYYNQDLSLAEISEHFDITRQGVRDSIKRAEQSILEYEDKLKLYERFSKNAEKVEKIKGLIEEIVNLNTIQLRNNLLHNWITELETILETLQI